PFKNCSDNIASSADLASPFLLLFFAHVSMDPGELLDFLFVWIIKIQLEILPENLIDLFPQVFHLIPDPIKADPSAGSGHPSKKDVAFATQLKADLAEFCVNDINHRGFVTLGSENMGYGYRIGLKDLVTRGGHTDEMRGYRMLRKR